VWQCWSWWCFGCDRDVSGVRGGIALLIVPGDGDGIMVVDVVVDTVVIMVIG